MIQVNLIEGSNGDLPISSDAVRNVRGRRKRAPTVIKPAEPVRTVPVSSEPTNRPDVPWTGECPRLGPDGKCNGLYYGFTCIKEKCKMQDREAVCEFCIGGDYCLKYNRFGCVGPDNCGTKDDYLAFIRKEREKVEAYQ